MSFAQNLLRLRQQNVLIQRQMTERLGITVSQSRHFETKGGYPSLAVLQIIAGCFAVPSDWSVCERSERQALPEDLRLQFKAVGRLRLDEWRAIRALFDDLIHQYMARRNTATKPLPAACVEATGTSPQPRRTAQSLPYPGERGPYNSLPGWPAESRRALVIPVIG